MIQLTTTDNSFGRTVPQMILSEKSSISDSTTAYKSLFSLSNKTLNEIVAQNPDLLVFPDCIEKSEDQIQEQHVITCDRTATPESNPETVKIGTGNIAGFIGFPSIDNEKEVHLKITSRFVNDYPNNEDNDFFLYYLLEKVFAVNLFDFKALSRNGEFDFLLYLFPYYLKKALSRGLFKTYTFYKRNDMNICGQIDVARHIKENTPFRGNIACNIRERTGDNYLIQLIRHTIEVIKSKSIGKHILSYDNQTRNAVDEIIRSTPSYQIRERNKVIKDNLKVLKHPYFTDYVHLQKLCLAILRRQKLNYGKDTKKIYGLLFDVAWLWEEYLAILLKQHGFKHPQNKKGSGWLYLFENKNSSSETDKNYSRIYPDFYKPDAWVLDAKYKKLTDGKISRDDMYQMITYMHVMKIHNGGFLYPRKETENDVNESKTFILKGYGGTIQTFGLKIPLTPSSMEDFMKMMNKSEKILLEKINSSNNKI